MIGSVKRYPWAGVALLLALLMGCSGKPTPPSYGSTEGKEIADFMDEFDQYKNDLKSLSGVFAGKPPATWKKFAGFAYQVEGTPTVTGNSATATIRIRTDGGEDRGTKEWTFEKTGNDWKIKDAPLP